MWTNVVTQQASLLAPQENLGMHPWTEWWNPWNTKDRQVLVQPPVGATRGIHGKNRYWPTLVCALGVHTWTNWNKSV
ncbi:hypothetical protein PGTUg99_031072 [Puccinia graminis f. sp. tritici]|uniref:Uncharacterized protein n=1 Tax=Puccinia graminis f. sp. tritici TaxID=56615 RepID=A0A5B0LWN4_PUCGR|nr:hypothetical protein PGTUg99_031072 [Puccinia graminis f. sp. tritici]